MCKEKKLFTNINNSFSNNQEKVDNCARTYNTKFKPYNRGLQKGLIGLKRTRNGGVSFKKSPYIFHIRGRPVYVKIKATGSRRKDFKLANAKFGFLKTPSGYTWHHLDDYNINKNTFTLELVLHLAHRATTPHSGGCAQYKAATGHRYK